MPVSPGGDFYAQDELEVETIDHRQEVPIPGDFSFSAGLLVAVSASEVGIREPAVYASLDFQLEDSLDGHHWHLVPVITGGRLVGPDRPFDLARIGVPFGPRLRIVFIPDDGSAWKHVRVVIGSQAPGARGA